MIIKSICSSILQESLIVLEEDLVLSPDFLYFMAQTYPVVRQDKTLVGVSAWNDNCKLNTHLRRKVLLRKFD